MAITLASLLNVATYTELLEKALDVAESVGLPVSSWRPGDPTRSQYQYLAEVLSTLEPSVQAVIASGFLDYAEGDALTNVALQVYGVSRTEATFAGAALVLENTGGGLYNIAAGDVTFKSSVTGRTYRNTTGGTLASGPGMTLELSWVADEAGTLSSVGVDEIDEIVTALLGVEVQSSEAGLGVDEESDTSLRDRCRDSLGALSPNGPSDAYAFVARNSELTGVTNVTRVSVVAEDLGAGLTGQVYVYLAGSSGAVDAPTVAAVSDAIAQWAAPLCVTPNIASAANLAYSVEATVYVRSSLGKTESQVQTEAAAAVNTLLAGLPIGGYTNELHRTLVAADILAATGAHRIAFTTPASETLAVQDTHVVVPGTLTFHVVLTNG